MVVFKGVEWRVWLEIVEVVMLDYVSVIIEFVEMYDFELDVVVFYG